MRWTLGIVWLGSMLMAATALVQIALAQSGSGTGASGETGGSRVVGSSAVGGRSAAGEVIEPPAGRQLGTGSVRGGDYDDLSTTRGASRATSGRSTRRAGDFAASTQGGFLDETRITRARVGTRPERPDYPGRLGEELGSDTDDSDFYRYDGRSRYDATGRSQRYSSRNGADADWRYRWHRGMWWYYTPSDRWAFWEDDRWNSYDPDKFAPSLDADRNPRSDRFEDTRSTSDDRGRGRFDRNQSNMDDESNIRSRNRARTSSSRDRDEETIERRSGRSSNADQDF